MEFDWLTKYRKKTEYQKVMLLYLLLNDYKANIHHADTEIETESYGKTYTKVYGYTTDMIDVEAIQTDIRQTPKPIVCSKKDYQSIAKSQNVFLYQPRFEKDLVINDIDIISGVMLIDKNIVISDMLERDAIIDFTNAVGTPYKTKMYYDTFLIAPQKTANTILITTAVDLQIFSTKEVDFITREDEEHEEMNINIDKIATQQSYLFLGIPQSHQAYNFLIAMLYSQLYGRLYELGEQKLRNKWHIGYQVGIPVFDYFDTEEQAKEFYETITENDIIPADYVNNTQIYRIIWNDHVYKSSVLREPLEKFIRDLDKMYIWNGDDYGGAPALPIHINFLLDEFKNIGEIPNFLTILSTSRKYRIGSHVVIQDIGQLKTMYKDGEHETVMANVDTTIFLGSILKEDKEEIQKMLGKTTIRQKSTSSSNSGLSTSYTPTEVDLMSIDEIGAINQGGRDDELVIIRDTTPYLCRKLNLTEHKRWEDVKAVKQLKIDASQYYRNTKDDEKMLN